MEFVILRDSETELQHHGTKGMRWGVRRYQNKDGSLTPLGEKHRSLGQRFHDYKVKKNRVKSLKKARATKEANKKAQEEAAKKAAERAKLLEKGKIPAKKMTDAELADALRRKENEKKYKEAVLATSPGKRFVSKVWNDGIVPGMIEGGKKAVSGFAEKKLSDALGLNKKEAKSALELAKEAADMAKYKKLRFQDERDLAEAKDKYEQYKKNKAAQEKAAEREFENDARYFDNQRKSNKEYQDKRKQKENDDTERFEATADDVVGEGTSSSQYKNRHGFLGSNKKPDGYYDPIDVEGVWVNEHSNTSTSNLPAVQRSAGRTYITALLEDKSYLLEDKG